MVKQEATVKLSIRLPDRVRYALEAKARRNNTSLSQIANESLGRWLDQDGTARPSRSVDPKLFLRIEWAGRLAGRILGAALSRSELDRLSKDILRRLENATNRPAPKDLPLYPGADEDR